MPRVSADVDLEVPFHDLDVLQVAWHGHYLKYFEIARCALLRKIDYDYPQMAESGYVWPIVECRLKYVRSARYGQRLRVHAELVEYENRLKVAYRIDDAVSAAKLTQGHTIQVAVDAKTGELQFVSPAIVFEKVEKACSA